MLNNKKTIIVETKCGPVRGILRKSFMGDDFYSFKKIPYAEPPLGNLRFKDPQPPKPWQMPIDGTEQGPTAYHNDLFTQQMSGDEDCLHVNVFTKELKPKKTLPVMVWIHGGAFLRGSSNENWYGPDYLLQKDIVFISFNYRLGALGFLSLDNPTYNIPGNAGLKDQTMALKWVKENCSLFGGDSTNITIFGESAGGASVHYHLISDLSKNLFHKAIIMSGCTLNNWSVTPKKDFVQRLAIALGWDEQGEFDEAFEFIQNAKPGDIVKAQEWILSPDEQRQQVLIPFGPTIEPYVSEQCMIPKNPIEMCRTAWSNNVVKIMIGGNSDEGLYKYKDAIQNPKIFQFLGNFEFLVPLELNLSRDDVKCREIGIKMKRYYFDDKEPSKETINEYINIMTDKLFWHGIHRTVMSRLKYSADAATYLYRFNFDSETFNHFRIAACGKGVRGSCHADDLSYLFKNQFVDKLVVNSDEFKTINRMVGIWTKFAINGNPNDAEIKPLNWEPVKDIEPPFKCLNISNQLDIIDLPETKRMAFWDSIYEGTDLY